MSHEEAVALARTKYQTALDLLHESAAIVRSDDVKASNHMMNVEKDLTRVIELLSSIRFPIA